MTSALEPTNIYVCIYLRSQPLWLCAGSGKYSSSYLKESSAIHYRAQGKMNARVHSVSRCIKYTVTKHCYW